MLGQRALLIILAFTRVTAWRYAWRNNHVCHCMACMQCDVMWLATGQAVRTNIYYGLNWCSMSCATAVVYSGFCVGWGRTSKARGSRCRGGWSIWGRVSPLTGRGMGMVLCPYPEFFLKKLLVQNEPSAFYTTDVKSRAEDKDKGKHNHWVMGSSPFIWHFRYH